MSNGSNASRATRRTSSSSTTLNNAVNTIMTVHNIPAGNRASVQSWVSRRAQRIIQTGQAATQQQALNMAVNQYNPKLDPNITQRQPWADMSTREARSLQASMGQTGNEAGLLKGELMRMGRSFRDTDYAGTSKSYNVNAALASDMKSMSAKGSAWDRNGLKMSNPSNPHMGVKQIIQKMDSGMKPLPKNLNLTRMDYGDRVLDSFGLSGVTVNQLMKMSPSDLNKAFYGATRQVKSYSSALYSEKNFANDTFKQRDVVIQYEVRRGTHAIVTNNVKETEIVIGRGYDQMVKSANVEYVFGQPKLVLNVVITPNARSGYYKV